jgi:hypothetical protein
VGRVLEQPADLLPDRRIELLDTKAPGVAPALAVEAVTLRPGAAVVVVYTSRRAWIARLPAAAIRVAAVLADQQTLQQIADAFEALAVLSPVLVQLRLRALEQRGFDQRRDWDGDPTLGRGRRC